MAAPRPAGSVTRRTGGNTGVLQGAIRGPIVELLRGCGFAHAARILEDECPGKVPEATARLYIASAATELVVMQYSGKRERTADPSGAGPAVKKCRGGAEEAPEGVGPDEDDCTVDVLGGCGDGPLLAPALVPAAPATPHPGAEVAWHREYASSVQIQADPSEVRNRISAFIASKRGEVDASNTREYAVLELGDGGCARARPVPRTGDDRAIRLVKVSNAGCGASRESTPLLPDGVEGRLRTLEQRLMNARNLARTAGAASVAEERAGAAPAAVPRTVYARIKALEDMTSDIEARVFGARNSKDQESLGNGLAAPPPRPASASTRVPVMRAAYNPEAQMAEQAAIEQRVNELRTALQLKNDDSAAD